jgi:hypothetical protein
MHQRFEPFLVHEDLKILLHDLIAPANILVIVFFTMKTHLGMQDGTTAVPVN